MNSSIHRRNAILGALFGAGSLGLRSLATGLPAWFLAAPRTARAADPTACDAARAQFLVLMTSSGGDPINANVPGMYGPPDINHPAQPEMAPVSISLGGKAYDAAKPWSTLPASALARTSFFHTASYAVTHPSQPKVMRLMGAVKSSEMLTSAFAVPLAQCMGTIQTEPISLAANGGEALSFKGRALQGLTPAGLQKILSAPDGPLAKLRSLRDQQLDQISAVLKDGTTPTQRAFLDRYASSQLQARSISDALLTNLDRITGNTETDQAIAAATLIKLKVAPALTVHFAFGGDNHSDAELAGEAAETVSGVAAIATLLSELKSLGLEDQVTIASMNVFGRTLTKNPNGRAHHGGHNVLLMIGKNVRAGVVGGIQPTKGSGGYIASPIDSKSGTASPNGDIGYDDVLGAAGKTLGAALGLPKAMLDETISRGKIVASAVVG